MTTTTPTPPPAPKNRVPQVMVLVLTLTLLLGIFLVGTLLRSQNGADPEETTTTTIVAANTTTPTTTTIATTTTELATTTSEETTTTSSTTTAPPAGLSLRASGLGSVVFGTDAEQAISTISGVLGTPTEDTGWDTTGFLTCPGNENRVVGWDNLQVFFSDGPTDWAPAGVPHFFHYSMFTGGSLDLTTENGVTVGTSVADLQAAFGPDVTVVDDPVDGPIWVVDVPGAGILWGTVTNTSDDGVVDSINGGEGCSE